VIVRVDDLGERIPLTICDADRGRETITLVVQAVGATTERMIGLRAGDELTDVVGPLGRPTDLERVGVVAVVAGGVGAAIALPVARALRDVGNRVVGVVGARSRDHVILEREFRDATDRLLVTTDDGSYGRDGFVTDALADVLIEEPVALVHAVGPIPMMHAVADLTRDAGVPTVVSLNPIMVDGTGMCGGCRVSIAGETRFACVDGPEFDAHLVDFDLLALRNRAYVSHERRALEGLHRG
jgi:ferredoxin--NADP+ reductase